MDQMGFPVISQFALCIKQLYFDNYFNQFVEASRFRPGTKRKADKKAFSRVCWRLEVVRGVKPANEWHHLF